MTIEHGQLFKGEMVRAILEDRKTQTRRLITAHNSLVDGAGMGSKRWAAMGFDFSQAAIDPGPSPAGNLGPYLKVPSAVHGTWHRIYPRVQPGHNLWVRETWQGPLFEGEHGDVDRRSIENPKHCVYAADGGPAPEFMDADDNLQCRWRPAIHMPRWACRLVLPVHSVRVERLQQISEADALAEGVWTGTKDMQDAGKRGVQLCHVGAYLSLWDSINGAGAAMLDPLVWIYDFKRS